MKNRIQLVVIFVATVMSAACMCSTDRLYSSVSPGKKRTIVVSRRNCGATSGFTTVVTEQRGWMRPDVELFELGGEALGEKQLRLGWINDDELIVGADKALALHPIDLEATDLKVGYEPGTRLGS